ncbi:unnamed protein product [Soboliphyme baturini]|uniref:t-SNARE coiled-coil homology domain-containing protein n=1 Tax=Soboliphyme baturini TaxID=241478 RepID=A0A183ITI4_9BILA|nr:unnamed protein product [Soboliphyme baturini]
MTRISELKELQQKHLTRPSFSDEGGLEEKNIEALTREITKMMCHVQNILQVIQQSQVSGTTVEKFRRNIVSAHVDLLQKLNVNLRQSQNRYLHQLQSYEDACEKYFGSFTANGPSLPDYQFQNDGVPPKPEALSMSKIQMQEENAALFREREKEIACISDSILELNHLFKDLAAFVVDQSTVLDRIDYNIERSCLAAKSGYHSIRKVSEYQKKNRKMILIVSLSCLVIILLVILIVVKT